MERAVEFSSLDKILFPDAGITKGDLINYYERIAPIMLPHLRERPLTMHRFPRGIDAKGFYQKEMPAYFPNWIKQVCVMVLEDGKEQPEVVVNDADTLVYLANQNMITPHVWLSRVDDLDHPDKLIFDLDPPEGDFETVRFAAYALREILEELGLVPFLMTTGSKGLHVVVPLEPTLPFEAVRDFALAVAKALAAQQPNRLTTETRIAKREGRLFLDYLRNAYGATSVVPYAIRAKPGAPVATPLDWDELGDRKMHSQRYTMANIFRRLGQKEDPWREIMTQARPLDEARRRLKDRDRDRDRESSTNGTPSQARLSISEDSLDAIAAEIENLEQSPLYQFRRENNYLSVPGNGDPEAEIMFIGEAPGEQEAKQGRPFVGAAGRVLSDLLASIGLSREDVYITNVVKDRPPNNRDPRPGEIALYVPFLERQLALIQPRVIATLGRFAMEFILDRFGLEKGKISDLHGLPLRARAPYGEVIIVPLYHPAVTFYRDDMKAALQNDFHVLKQFI